MTDRRLALTPDALTMIDAIARSGSFAAAARELGKVPSALTYSVRQLEESLDVLLFDRSSRQAHFTPAGRELLDEGRRLLQEMDAVSNRVRRIASGWESQLAISVEDVISMPTVFELVQAFCEVRMVVVDAVRADVPRRHAAAAGAEAGFAATPPAHQGPPTRLRLRTDVLAGTWEALTSGQVDLAIGVAGDHPNPGGIELRPLGDVQFVFCVAPHHPLAAGDAPLTDSELVHHRAVAVADTAQRMTPVTVNLLPGQDVLTVPTLRSKLEALLRNLGCGFLPETMVRAHVEAGRLVLRRTARSGQLAKLHYAWRGDRNPLALGRALRWWLEQLESQATRRALLERHAGPLA